MNDDDLKFKHPFSCILSAPSKSGKTSFCIRLLQNFAALCSERELGGGIVWCYSAKTAVPKRRLLLSNTTYHVGVPEKFGGGVGRPRLLIIDDLLNDVYSKQLCDMFKRGSHQRNISVNLITQNLFQHGRKCRNIMLNAHYVVALNTSEIRSSLCIWPITCILKIVLGYITPTWMRPQIPRLPHLRSDTRHR